ncbi:MAG: metallophosphoesterase [Gaiellaceae bacterium]
MRIAVISDVHANLAALESVLSGLEDERPDAVWNLGDAVGYGPLPNESCALLRERAAVSLVGNHDLVALDATEVDVEEFNPDAAAAAVWTRAALDEKSRAFLESLDPQAQLDGAALFHASPFDPVWGYVLTDEAAQLSLDLTEAGIVLVGHSHLPLAVTHANGGVRGGLAPHGTEVDLQSGRWLLNPGSVGQPRDGDPRAACLLLDTGAGTGSFRRIEYPVERTQAQMRELGLPNALAERLAHGV